jgi:hypothetical protein
MIGTDVGLTLFSITGIYVCLLRKTDRAGDCNRYSTYDRF